MRIGILSLQGDYAAHTSVLANIAKFRQNVTCHYVSTPEQLDVSDGLIIPGGESSVLLQLLHTQHLWPALQNFNKPILGTCAGAILLADQVISPEQPGLSRIEITVARNAYGRQIMSHVGQGLWHASGSAMEMIFIRAPKILTMSQNVRVLASYQDEPVAVQQNHFIALAFHPELTADTRVHEYFLDQLNN